MMAKRKSGIPVWFWLIGGAIGTWALYSRLLLNHEMPLANAIDAPRQEFFAKHASFLSYYHEKLADGRPLVLLHSINAAASSYEMRPFFAYYRGERPVFALDLTGFGFSERSQRDYSPSLYKAAILDFLRDMVQEPADVVALSLSSEFAALAAQESPELFHSLALISPTGLMSDLPKLRENHLYKLLANPAWSQDIYDLLVTKLSLRFFLSQNFVGEIDAGLLDYAYASSHQKGAPFAPLAFIGGKLFTANIARDVYTQLKTPTLVLYDQDPNTNFDLLGDVLSKNENWRARKIPNTKGLPHWERLEQVADALDSFWGSL